MVKMQTTQADSATLAELCELRRRRIFQGQGSILGTLLLALIMCGGCPTHAQSLPASRYDIEAVYLFDFAKFVRWPAGPEQGTLNICAAAPAEFIDALKKVSTGEHIDTHPLAVRAVQSPGDVEGCAILFIGSSAKTGMESLLAASAGKGILTVSDIPGFLDQAGMIQFLIVDNRVRFAVNLRPAASSGVSLSSELLKVAVSVKGGAGNGGTP